MKLSNDQDVIEQSIDIIELIEELKSTNRTVYWTHIYGQIYIYKPLGRRDHREICEDESLDTLSKEDEVCRRCLLYPNNIDFDNIEAGVISKLVRVIFENSFLSDMESRTAVLDYFRSEMFDLQNQITCIINEAFPQYDIEDIENWDIERTAKFLSRAEWKLQNFRGAVFNYDAVEQIQQDASSDNNNVQQDASRENEQSVKETPSNKQSMDRAKLEELKRKFPEIDWDADTIANEGIEGMKDAADSESVALRPGWF